MKIVLIPGMDGTGILFEPFVEAAPAEVEVLSLPLLQDAEVRYGEQAKYIIESIGDQPVVLVAESYSGMVAYNMLKIGCANVKHVVFVASFIARPSFLAIFAKYMPVALLKSNFVSKSFLGLILFGRYSSNDLVSTFFRAIGSVDDVVLKSRLSQIARLPTPCMPIHVPCSYIRPKNDWFVSKKSIGCFQELCENLSIYEIDGTHFILQTSPLQCWQIIRNVIDRCFD